MSKVYQTVMKSLDKIVPKPLLPLWQHPAGPKTIFFWAPLCKWGLVIAGFNDVIRRPVELITMNQCGSIAMTGLIWARYSVVIVPKNYSLCAVNVLVLITQGTQFLRALHYQQTHKKQ